MSRVAIVADIHANMPAFEAVIGDIQAQGVDEVIVAGDLVGRGPQGSAVVDRVRGLGWPALRGNHEDYLVGFYFKTVDPDWLESTYWCASRWMAAELDAPHADYIRDLPFSLESRTQPGISVVHGSPTSNQEGLGTWTDEDVLAAHLSAVPGSALICGHTHRPLLKSLEGGVVVNVGSVGLPFNGDTRAQYAIIDGAPGDWEVEFRHVPYDLSEILGIYESSGFLSAGGFTSALLVHEIERARPFLVPFIKWGEAMGKKPNAGLIPEFLGLYDPEAPMRELMERLESMIEARRSSQGDT